jgi:hypothetical protein
VLPTPAWPHFRASTPVVTVAARPAWATLTEWTSKYETTTKLTMDKRMDQTDWKIPTFSFSFCYSPSSK